MDFQSINTIDRLKISYALNQWLQKHGYSVKSKNINISEFHVSSLKDLAAEIAIPARLVIGDIYEILLNDFKKFVDIITPNTYNIILAIDKLISGESPTDIFEAASGGLSNAGPFYLSPNDTLELLLKSGLSSGVAQGLINYWQESNALISVREVQIAIKTHQLTSRSQTTALEADVLQLVPKSRFVDLSNSTSSAIEYYNQYWSKAVAAGITQQQLNSIDPDLLPEMRREVKRLKAHKLPVPKFKYPKIDRGSLDPIFADPSKAADYLEERRVRGRQAAKRHYKNKKT